MRRDLGQILPEVQTHLILCKCVSEGMAETEEILYKPTTHLAEFDDLVPSQGIKVNYLALEVFNPWFNYRTTSRELTFTDNFFFLLSEIWYITETCQLNNDERKGEIQFAVC